MGRPRVTIVNEDHYFAIIRKTKKSATASRFPRDIYVGTKNRFSRVIVCRDLHDIRLFSIGLLFESSSFLHIRKFVEHVAQNICFGTQTNQRLCPIH